LAPSIRTPENNSEVRKYFKKACDGGLAEGCNLLRGIQ
jgi:hypothetical protein